MIKVGVLRGGPSNEYEVSLKTGQNILNNLSSDYESKDVLIDKNGNWFLDGLQTSPQNASKKIDVFFNCLHGAYGEDGKIQQLLDYMHTPYTGSGSVASAFAMNKLLAKRIFITNGFKVPEHIILKVRPDLEKELKNIFNTWLMPVIVKPSSGGSSLGISLAQTFDELKKAVGGAFEYSNEVIIEEYIKGREATCGVLENFRNKNLYTFLPVEIVKPPTADFFNYNSKYSGESEEIIPGRFSEEEKKQIQELAKFAHQALGLRHYSRSDFIVSPRGIYILETNTLPGLTPESLYPKSLEAIGSNLKEFSEHLIRLALKNK